VKPYRGPPMTLGAAAAARVRLIVWWCREGGNLRLCVHLRQTGPTPQAKAPKGGRNPSEFHTAV
jgi:hypothetical protein